MNDRELLEPVEVVGYLYAVCDDLLLDHQKPNLPNEPLMTVAQHKRLMAAKDGDVVKVPRELLERIVGKCKLSVLGDDHAKVWELLAAAPKAEQPPVQEPVAWSLRFPEGENHEVLGRVNAATTYQTEAAANAYADMGQAMHPKWRAVVVPLYAAPQSVSDDAKDALVEGLETIALESTDEQARCCAHHYLATYRAAPQPVSDDAKDALVDALEQIARMTYDAWTNGAIACRIADEALSAYRAAQEKK